MKKKVLSILLCVAMFVTFMPTMTFAQAPEINNGIVRITTDTTISSNSDLVSMSDINKIYIDGGCKLSLSESLGNETLSALKNKLVGIFAEDTTSNDGFVDYYGLADEVEDEVATVSDLQVEEQNGGASPTSIECKIDGSPKTYKGELFINKIESIKISDGIFEGIAITGNTEVANFNKNYDKLIDRLCIKYQIENNFNYLHYDDEASVCDSLYYDNGLTFISDLYALACTFELVKRTCSASPSDMEIFKGITVGKMLELIDGIKMTLTVLNQDIGTEISVPDEETKYCISIYESLLKTSLTDLPIGKNGIKGNIYPLNSTSGELLVTDENIEDVLSSGSVSYSLNENEKVIVRDNKARAAFAKAVKEGRITGLGAGITGKAVAELSGEENSGFSLFGNAAQIQDVYYPTLAEALENAESGDYVYLASTYTDIALDIPEGATIVPNGFKFRMYRAEIATDTDASIVASYTSVQEAVDAINRKGDSRKGEIRLITNSDENFEVLSNMEVTFDLNGFTLGGKKNPGNITSEGKLIIKDSSEVTAPASKTALGKGEIKGDLIYNDDSHIEIVNGIFRANEENDEILAAGSQGFIMTVGGAEKWIVAGESLAKFMSYGLEYEIVDEDGNVVEDVDSEPGSDFELGEEYTAKIYFTGAEDTKIRSFDFTANYDVNKIKVAVPYSENNKYTTLGEEWNKGSMHYTMAVNDDVKIGSDGKVEVAEFTFKINEENKNLSVRDAFTLDFNRDATVGTMKSINEIPVATYKAVSGYISNKYDGVTLVDYAYAPEGYKLAIISNDTSSSDDRKFNLEGFSADKVYYTENPAYVAQSTNPQGMDIYGRAGVVKGVFLAFVKETAANTDISKLIGHKSVGYTVFDTTNYLGGNVDVNRDGKVSANDASDVYQMLIYDGTSGRGTKWGFEADNSQLYIPTFERLLSESNFDGKLYGTIEDVNNIINYYSKLNIF